MLKRSMLAIAILAVGATIALETEARKLTPDEVERLEDGEHIMIFVDEGKGYLGGTSYILIDEDIDKAWNAIQDASVYEEIYPTVIQSKVVSKDGNKSVVKMVQGEKGVKLKYYLNYTSHPDKYKLSWKLDKKRPHDIADNRGSFRFKTYKDGRVLMKMTSVLDLGNNLVESLFGKKIEAGMLRLPRKFRKFLKKPAADKYAP